MEPPASSRAALRVAVFCPNYEDPGGVRYVVQRHVEAVGAAGGAALVVARARRGAVRRRLVADDGTAAVVWRDRFPRLGPDRRSTRLLVRHFVPSLLRLVRALRGWRPDLIATHCSKFYAPWVMALRALVRVPVVVHVHNLTRTADGPEVPYLIRRLLRAADRVIAVSDQGAAEARAYLGADAGRVVMIPNGFDMTEMAHGAAWSHPRPYVLGLGRLSPEKGFVELLQAVATLPGPLDVLLAGEGEERAALRTLAERLGIAARVEILGAVDRATVGKLLRGAAVVAMPSRWEGHPLVCLEAMSAGTPIVAADILAFTGILRDGETALLVPVDDVPALARALADVLASPERARARAEAARGVAARMPRWEEVGWRVLAEYGAVTRRRWVGLRV